MFEKLVEDKTIIDITDNTDEYVEFMREIILNTSGLN